jgi:CheY-like chemotaxis protein/two-component sensor histidine kinase
LGSIMAESEVANMELPEGSPGRASVQKIMAVASSASGIVRQLMAYAGQESVDFQPLDLAALVREMIALMKVYIPKGAALDIDLPDEMPLVQGNPAQLQQVIMNLITNASQALGDKGGMISVKLALADGKRLRLQVSDTGCGMREEVQGRIFDPFFSTKGTGRGMGLAAVQGIVRAHGGTITVASEPGHGSCFELLFPIASAQTGLENEPRVSPGGIVKNETGTVLLIDHEDTLRAASAKMLLSKGYEVIDAADGDSGVALFQKRAAEIAVVLLDVTLPGISGRRILEEFYKVKPDVKVVLVSAHSRDHAIAIMGGDASLLYLRKPCRLAELTELLRAICSQTTVAQA